MAFRPAVIRALLLVLCCAIQIRIVGGLVADASGTLPDIEVASRTPNAVRIFNAVHSALRQWGSSIHHNGLSFLPVTIPEGNLFYHGRQDPELPTSLEWLAFEMEHASHFAQCREFHGDSLRVSMLDKSFRMSQSMSLHGKVSSMQSRKESQERNGEAQVPLFDSSGQGTPTTDDDHDVRPPNRWPHLPNRRGYLQTYRAARPLNLIYLDGMAAAKCHLGTLDSQNDILLDWHSRQDPMQDEWERAGALCSLARECGVDGYVRMEAGFEIIYCNFSAGAGLDLVSTHGSPWSNETHPSRNETGPGRGEWFVMGVFEWMRASAARYHGLPRGRAEIDFGGMVSAFAYDVDTTNPDPERPDLPRIVRATVEERHGIRRRVGEVMRSRGGKRASAVDWQAVVDNIVTRFSDRLWFLTDGPLVLKYFRSELATLLYPFQDFPDDISLENVTKPLDRCTEHHLSSVTGYQESWTPEDHAIYAAIRSVSYLICDSLFAMRKVAHTTNGTVSGDAEALQQTCRLAQELRTQLDWTTWKECGRCPEPDQMCFVAMFPSGDPEDHFAPRCKTKEDIGFGYFLAS